jgi:uncharacterized protein (TIGR02588 family)
MARRRTGQGPVPAIEWIGAAIGALIVLGTIGYLTYETVRSPGDERPRLSAIVTGVRPQDGWFAVDVEIRNGGRGAASDVHVAGGPAATDARQERPQASVDYVPGLSRREVTLLFRGDPGEHPDVQIIGYSRP